MFELLPGPRRTHSLASLLILTEQLISLCASQITTRIPDVFMVPFPSSAQKLLSIFEVFNVNISGLSLPLSCIGLGKYWERMFFTLLFPVVVAAGILFCSLVYAMCQKVKVKKVRGGMAAIAKQTAVKAVDDYRKSHLRVGWMVALPHLLRLSFLVFPMVNFTTRSNSSRCTVLCRTQSPPPNFHHQVSSAAFQAFACDEFDNGKSFLRADFAVECYTPEHESVRGLAILGILLCDQPRLNP